MSDAYLLLSCRDISANSLPPTPWGEASPEKAFAKSSWPQRPNANPLCDTIGYMEQEVPSQGFMALSRKIGFDATIALCRQYGGKRVYIPKLFTGLKAKRDSLIHEQHKVLGYSTRQLAHRWALTQRRIQQILEKQIQ